MSIVVGREGGRVGIVVEGVEGSGLIVGEVGGFGDRYLEGEG